MYHLLLHRDRCFGFGSAGGIGVEARGRRGRCAEGTVVGRLPGRDGCVVVDVVDAAAVVGRHRRRRSDGWSHHFCFLCWNILCVSICEFTVAQISFELRAIKNKWNTTGKVNPRGMVSLESCC
mmetsp:Transcript_21222/g.47388  ORF Transcript_21222/g.47388 Transcript_21222/m.47388 type:complete len:123 (+) Transcript_21222:823-1191(+)